MLEAIKEILEQIEKRKINNKKDLDKLKAEISHKYKLKSEPKLIHLFIQANKRQREKYSLILKTKPVRTISGVAPVALFATPLGCPPQAKCIYCPGGPGSIFGNVPKSYTGNEPASRRAARNNYDPYLQIFNRLEHYALLNQNFDKVEIIIMGGTFPFYPKKYKDKFITYVYKALNDFSEMFFKNNEFQYKKFNKFFELPTYNINDAKRTEKIHQKLLKIKGTSDLVTEQLRNEKAKIRCIGLTIETRPDLGKLNEGNEMLNYGTTKIELGIQSVFDEDLEFVKRGHSVQNSIESIRVLKDLGFKLLFHYMLGLTQNRKKDLEGLKTLFSNSDFRPDMIKIYPCLVIKGTELYNLWKQDKYKPITTEEAAEIISEAKRFIPKYNRINRIQRDISSNVIEAGVKFTNLRQLVNEKCKEKNIRCNCVRCRESGHMLENKQIKIEKIKFLVYKYEASKGKEFFISAEDTKNNILFGYCRLRFPSQYLRPEIIEGSALIRELHVYSPAIPIGEKSETSFQHRGIGKQLLKITEGIAKKYSKNKLLIISSIGAREYFRKVGYKLEEPYMIKFIN